ncbi:CvpA family protein [Falsiroseomonas oryzae]|uniref:CvpA family protein n=1 Tax=Falsiroseomonas oryzae TaxID=2766473 RepID=UPI0022EB070E|nr:CvpA family protein [Roseomonas sp. MO-31]
MSRGEFDTPPPARYTRPAMTWVDGVVLAVLLLSAGLAYFRGMVREVLGIGAWAGAIVAGILAEPATRPIAAQYVQPDWLATGIAVGAVFLVVLIVLKILIHWVAGKVQRSALGGVDRALGFVFGLARGAFVVVLAYIVGGLAMPDTARWPEEVRQARSLPLVADGAQWAVSQLPADFRPALPAAGRQDPSLDQLLRPPARSRT